MEIIMQLFDGLLCMVILLVAWQSLTTKNLFKAIVLFITFGLLMTIAWARLQAPDVAMAEVAIGAGLTGALLLGALAKLQELGSVEKDHKDSSSNNFIIRLLLIVLLVLLVSILSYVVLLLPESAINLQNIVEKNITTSGVSNPVTAVLLNFRAYDTFLEMVVLLVALLGVWSIKKIPIASITDIKNSVLDTLVEILTPLLILICAYLLWVGAHAPGGAFQAGSVLGAAFVLLMMSGRQPFLHFQGLPLHFALVVSLTLFIIIAIVSMLITGELLKYPLSQSSTIIFILESMATISISLTLALLFYSIYTKQEYK